jgi:putative transposase
MSALPHLGMAWSARLGQRRKPQLRRKDTSPSAPKKRLLESWKNLTQIGHPRKSPYRASLRSDNCPIIPDQCPTISDFVSDFIGMRNQGVQFTSAQFQAPLLAAQVRLSMDGRGRAFDNIFVERLWRTVKYEEVYLKDYRNVPEARHGLDAYFPFYNEQRMHQALDYRTPQDVHFASPQ